MKTSRRQFSKAACLTCIRLALTTFISIITLTILSSTWSIIIHVQKRARLTLANMATAALRILRESLNFSCHLRSISLSQVSHQSPSSIPELCLFIRNICQAACQGQCHKSFPPQAPCVLTVWGSIMWPFSYMIVLYFASENSLMNLMAPAQIIYLSFLFLYCLFSDNLQARGNQGSWSGDQMEDYEHTKPNPNPLLWFARLSSFIKMQWSRNKCMFFIGVFTTHTPGKISLKMKVVIKKNPL